MLLPVKGMMEVKQLQESRFLLRFKHIIDKQRAMEGCPWSFEKNIVILKPIGELENPMQVALEDWTLIGNRIGCSGIWRLMTQDARGVRRCGSRSGGNLYPMVVAYLVRLLILVLRFSDPSRGLDRDTDMIEDEENLGLREVHNSQQALAEATMEQATLVEECRNEKGLTLCETQKSVMPKEDLTLNLVNIPLGWAPPWTVCSLTKLIKLHRPGLVFLSETKCQARRGDRVKELVNYNGIGVNSVGKGGCVLLLWRKDIDVWLQSYSFHHIDATVKSDDYPVRWRFTRFYGYPDVGNRKEGWALLRKLAQQSVRPLICAGDFNEILEQYEKQGALPRAQWQIRDFRQCLDDCGLQDMGFKGDKFTWCNRRETLDTVQARLDRACSNAKGLFCSHWLRLLRRQYLARIVRSSR
ncbi:UNVERIFIED_CONTAM: hypothetical protein Slati_0108000 [Sesamum latifolium]|uniref:Endonuclease/exonuclease/phosphatase domain-containing protein n=1 Tax=Sesamum latifolium TaxID=2727402 RepID=A0AAW2Y8V2_9LAMI